MFWIFSRVTVFFFFSLWSLQLEQSPAFSVLRSSTRTSLSFLIFCFFVFLFFHLERSLFYCFWSFDKDVFLFLCLWPSAWSRLSRSLFLAHPPETVFIFCCTRQLVQSFSSFAVPVHLVQTSSFCLWLSSWNCLPPSLYLTIYLQQFSFSVCAILTVFLFCLWSFTLNSISLLCLLATYLEQFSYFSA